MVPNLLVDPVHSFVNRLLWRQLRDFCHHDGKKQHDGTRCVFRLEYDRHRALLRLHESRHSDSTRGEHLELTAQAREEDWSHFRLRPWIHVRCAQIEDEQLHTSGAKLTSSQGKRHPIHQSDARNSINRPTLGQALRILRNRDAHGRRSHNSDTLRMPPAIRTHPHQDQRLHIEVSTGVNHQQFHT